MKKINFGSLISIYSNFILQKLTLIIFTISLLVIGAFLYFTSDISGSEAIYSLNFNDFHLLYFEQALLILQIFNSIIAIALVISISVSSISFDTMFVSYIKRSKIVIAKIINLLFILLIIVLIELVIVVGIAYLRFSYFKPNLVLYTSFVYMYISLSFEAIFIFLLSTIFNNIFTCLGGMFLFMVIRLLCNNNISIKLELEKLIPILSIDSSNYQFILNNPLISVIWISIICILLSCIYNIKDLS